MSIEPEKNAPKSDEKEAAAGYEAEAALREALVGNMILAKQQAHAALALASGRDERAMSAVALGMAGESEQALQLADDLNKRFTEDTVVQFNYLPTIRAAVALHAKDIRNALDALSPAAHYELGTSSQNFNFYLYPIYVRGEALLAGDQAASAATEFQKILDHPGLVLNEPIGALAHLELGRAYTLQGDTAKARAKYQEFLTLWKDADADIPILKQAKAEYEKLQ